MKKLSATQIGYLRRAAPSAGEPRKATGPAKAMLRKLAILGLAEEDQGHFRRTLPGDEAVTAFDGALSRDELRTLTSLLPNAPVAPAYAFVHSLAKLNAAGLVYYTSNLRAVTTHAGEDVLEANRERVPEPA